MKYSKIIPTYWEKGNIMPGIVKNIQPYGAFIEIKGSIVGLLKIQDISIARMKNPSERLKIGQKIQVMIKSIDRENNRIMLTYKELLGTWEENVQGIQEGMTMSGIIRETAKEKNGIFIELKPNLIGLAEYRPGMIYGQEVNVHIRRIIPEKKKIKLVIL